jgi:hypothetical protein
VSALTLILNPLEVNEWFHLREIELFAGETTIIGPGETDKPGRVTSRFFSVPDAMVPKLTFPPITLIGWYLFLYVWLEVRSITSGTSEYKSFMDLIILFKASKSANLLTGMGLGELYVMYIFSFLMDSYFIRANLNNSVPAQNV